MLNLARLVEIFCKVTATFCSFSSVPCKTDKIFCNFHWNPFWNLALKFERFSVLNHSVQAEFCTLSSHSSTKSFTPHKYSSYLQMMPDQNLRYSKLPLIVPSRRLINLWLWTLGLSFGFKGPLSSRTGSRDDVTSTFRINKSGQNATERSITLPR